MPIVLISGWGNTAGATNQSDSFFWVLSGSDDVDHPSMGGTSLYGGEMAWEVVGKELILGV